MFSKVLVIFFLLSILSVGSIVHAQLLRFDGDDVNEGSVVVGTTTYNFSLPPASIKSAKTQLQEIYYYLRNADSIVDVPNVTSNYYSDITNVTFGRSSNTGFGVGTNPLVESTIEKCPFTLDLNSGSQGLEVLMLQKFLNGSPETLVASVGVGSIGNETDYFGSLTFNAVFAFQAKYAAEILTPLGLVNPTGYWGSATRKYANTLSGC